MTPTTASYEQGLAALRSAFLDSTGTDIGPFHPVDPDVIRQVESELAAPLPDELRQFYTVADGIRGIDFAPPRIAELPLLHAMFAANMEDIADYVALGKLLPRGVDPPALPYVVGAAAESFLLMETAGDTCGRLVILQSEEHLYLERPLALGPDSDVDRPGQAGVVSA